ncbi:hypothetical protein HJC23_001376 [Cyclotella cryptica]|uniref:Uncharacterized protein n=1 Tax=Cyclotella cryptica TaxID=29204 RepID=A0ABD3P8R6_9STRA
MSSMNRNGSPLISEPMVNQFQHDDYFRHASTNSSSAHSAYSNQEPQHIIEDISSDDGNTASHSHSSSHHSNRRSQSRSRSHKPEFSSPSTARLAKQPQRSFSRRTSLGGTTIYKTPDMAKMDKFLRSSGLRLKPDGTCQFLFETTRFIIETTTDIEETGEFLFYCSLGKLRELRENFGRSQRNLLKMLALWNEELQMDGNEDTGLLRIDSSKEDGPHVSFIYYGQMENISSSEQFQELLDQFVDDALDFFDKLNNGEVDEDPSPIQTGSFGGASNHGSNHVGNQSNMGSAKSLKSHSTSTTVSSHSSDEGPPLYANHGPKGHSFHRTTSPPHSAATTTAYAPEFVSSSTSLNNSSLDKSGTGTKKSVFSKVISSLRTKNDPTVAMAFIDPSNPSSAFVVDKNAAASAGGLEERVKPTIVISRKGAERKEMSPHSDGRDSTRNHHAKHAASFHVDESSRHRSSRKEGSKSFYDDRTTRSSKRTSLADVQEDDRRPSYVSKRSSQPSVGEDSYDKKHYPNKCASFYDSKRPSISDESSRKSKSFHHTSKSKRSSLNQEECSDFSGSVHRVDKKLSHNTSFNRSVDILNESVTSEQQYNASLGGFNYSEPVLPSHSGKSKKSSLRHKQVRVQKDTHQDQQQQERVLHNNPSGHRRKTLNDAERPKPSHKHQRGAHTADRAMKGYYERHNAYPPPPPPRTGSKWSMKNLANDNEYESDECSVVEEGLYD